MSTHDELKASAAGYVLGSLDGPERRAFESHLVECAECAAEVASLRPVVGAARHRGPAGDAARPKFVIELSVASAAV